jgi:hypothetical protein
MLAFTALSHAFGARRPHVAWRPTTIVLQEIPLGYQIELTGKESGRREGDVSGEIRDETGEHR